MNVRGVFFDLYGTLLIFGDMVAAWDGWISCIYRAFAKGGLSVDKSAFKSRCDGFFERPEPPADEDDRLTIYERRLRDLGTQHGLALPDDDLRKLARDSIATWRQHIRLDPDARDLLAELGATKTLALISNFDHPPHVHSLLAELGLSEFFTTIIVSGEVGAKKPSPEIFSMALKATGLQPGDVAYVGDMLREDIEGSKAAGMIPILIERERPSDQRVDYDYRADSTGPERPAAQRPDGVNVISSLSDLKQLVL